MSRLFLLKSHLKNNMQSFAKCSNRYFVSSFRHSLHYGPKENSLLEKQTQKLWNYEGCRMFHPVSRYDLKQVRKEYHAVRSLLLRSGWSNIPRISRLSNIRALSTSSTSASNKHGGNSSNDPPKKDEEDPKKDEWGEKLSAFLVKAVIWTVFVYILYASTMILFRRNNYPNEIPRVVSWNEFVHHMLAKGEVEELIIKPEVDMIVIVLHDGAVIKGRRSDHKYYQMVVADVMQFEEKLRETERNLGIKIDQRVPVIYERKDYIFGYILTTLIMIMIVLMFFSRMRKLPNPMTFLSQMTRAKFTLVDPLTGTGKGVRFDDVAGLQEAKVEVMEFVDYLKRPQHYKTLGAKVPRGALLLGPPGCGKTLLAKAVATEANVPFLSMNGSEFIEMIGGLGAARMRSLFKEGRSRSPAIIYIDEIDAIGKKRSDSKGAQYDGGSGETEQTLNQLLVEMDGMASKDGVIVLASTNRAEVLDKALLRPGRFDRHILIDLPTLEERRQIFEQHLKGITLEHKPQHYSKMLAHLTPGFSGADIANVCNEAALHAARYKKKLVDGSDLSYAVDRVVGGTEKRDHAMSPAERRVVAYHESGHALVGWLLEHTDALLKVTIVPRTNLALGFAQYVPTDQKLYSREQLFERMCMMLGGRVAESLTFNKISTGAQNDLEKVTKIAYAQIQQYGMDPIVGLLSFDQEQTSTKTKKPYSKQMASLMDEEARRLIVRVYQNTEKVLSENKDKLKLLAETLLKKETLNYDDVVKLIGPPPHGKKRLIEPADFESSVKVADIPSAQPAPA